MCNSANLDDCHSNAVSEKARLVVLRGQVPVGAVAICRFGRTFLDPCTPCIASLQMPDLGSRIGQMPCNLLQAAVVCRVHKPIDANVLWDQWVFLKRADVIKDRLHKALSCRMDGLQQKLVQTHKGQDPQKCAKDEAKVVRHDGDELPMPLHRMHTTCNKGT